MTTDYLPLLICLLSMCGSYKGAIHHLFVDRQRKSHGLVWGLRGADPVVIVTNSQKKAMIFIRKDLQ
jgi:hypothetical protein